MRLRLRKLLWVVALAAVAALLVWAFLPAPVEVDAVELSRGPIEAVINQEGRTRVRDRYVISAPLAGHLLRVEARAGDAVAAGQTVLAVIQPTHPSLLDARQLAEAEARVAMAQAALERAVILRKRSAVELEWAETELGRVKSLQPGTISQKEFNDATFQVGVRTREHEAAYWAEQVSRHELEVAEAALRFVTGGRAGRQTTESGTAGQLALRAPVDGQVLRVIQESEAPVQAGAALLEIGHVGDLEVVIDVLSREAVRIAPGDAVRFLHWGGETPLRGAVRRVEPSAFTKVSALGVEEQRVNVIADLLDESAGNGLGDGFRVDAQIIVDEQPGAMKVPVGALLRHGEAWAVYTIVEDVAKLVPIRLGLRGSLEAEVLEGLQDGDRVIVYPSDQVRDGVRVKRR